MTTGLHNLNLIPEKQQRIKTVLFLRNAIYFLSLHYDDSYKILKKLQNVLAIFIEVQLIHFRYP